MKDNHNTQIGQLFIELGARVGKPAEIKMTQPGSGERDFDYQK